MKKWFLLFISVLTIIALAACTTNSGGDDSDTESNEGNESSEEGESEGAESEEKVLYMNNGEEPTSLNPPVGFDSVSWNVLNNLMEGLTRLGKDDKPQPAMAEDWEKSNGGKTYTFHLRENANWSNGDPVRAEDFVYAWKQLLNPETGSPAAFLGYFIEGGEAYNSGEGSAEDVMVKAVDEKTFEVTLTAPTGYFFTSNYEPGIFPSKC